MVRLSSAEKAERTRQGLCWYCPEKWIAGHSCKRTFLAFMGEDDDAEESENVAEPISPSEVVADNLSHMYTLEGRSRASSHILQGVVGQTTTFILIDTGSMHNFVHPKLVEKCKLPLTSVRPFRVYVGNGQSPTCSHMSAQVTIRIQDYSFEVDLYVLAVHGQNIVLGTSWLRSLHRVTSVTRLRYGHVGV